MKTEKELKKISKYMSYVLRHDPFDIGIILDSKGWANSQVLCEKLEISFEELEHIVLTNNKQRFVFNDDKALIRANQGHSIGDIDLNLKKLTVDETPEYIYHGTSPDILANIMDQGLKKMKRNHVHLSSDVETAKIVGTRKTNEPVIIQINAKEFVNEKNTLYLSENNVYLTDYVNPKYFKAYLNIS